MTILAVGGLSGTSILSKEFIDLEKISEKEFEKVKGLISELSKKSRFEQSEYTGDFGYYVDFIPKSKDKSLKKIFRGMTFTATPIAILELSDIAKCFNSEIDKIVTERLEF